MVQEGEADLFVYYDCGELWAESGYELLRQVSVCVKEGGFFWSESWGCLPACEDFPVGFPEVLAEDLICGVEECGERGMRDGGIAEGKDNT